MSAGSKQRRKAVDGLDKLPTTTKEWHDKVIQYRLENYKLQDICLHGMFFAAHIKLYLQDFINIYKYMKAAFLLQL